VYKTLLTKFDTSEAIVHNKALKNRGGLGIATSESTSMEAFSKLKELKDSFNQGRNNLKRSIIENRWPKP